MVEDEPDALRTLLELLRSDSHITDGARSCKMSSRYGADRPKLVAVTGWIQESDRILARIAGFDRRVAKPYDPAALLGLLGDITRSAH